MSFSETDQIWMRRALAQAERGRGHVEPNPMVGAAVVRDRQIVGLGCHARFGGPHAEVLALQQAGDSARGATLYVTLEPCCHQGKTPPCTDAILAAGIRRVVAAMRDPFPRVDGGGFERLRDAGLVVESGLLSEPARRLNAPYLKRLATGRPYVTAKWAMTLDGKTATANGHSRWITGERSRALVHELRGRVDCVAVGLATVLADDPELTSRPAGPRTPARLVLDSGAGLPLSSRLVRTAHQTPVWVAVTERASNERVAALGSCRCEVLAFPSNGRVPVGPLLDELGRRGITNLLLEGGGRVLGAFLDAGEVDAVEAFIAPILEGGHHEHTPARGAGLSSMSDALRLIDTTVQVLDGDTLIRGTIAQPWQRTFDGFDET